MELQVSLGKEIFSFYQNNSVPLIIEIASFGKYMHRPSNWWDFYCYYSIPKKCNLHIPAERFKDAFIKGSLPCIDVFWLFINILNYIRFFKATPQVKTEFIPMHSTEEIQLHILVFQREIWFKHLRPLSPVYILRVPLLKHGGGPGDHRFGFNGAASMKIIKSTI